MSVDSGAPSSTPPRPRVGAREWATVSAVLLMFVAAQLLSLLLVDPFQASGVQGFEDPQDWKNGLWLLLIVVVFTLLILYIARKKKEQWIRLLILASVFFTLVYVFYPLLDLLPLSFFSPQTTHVGPWNFDWNPAVAVAFLPALLLTGLLVKFPEWYIVDAVGIGVSAGAIAIFGSSFTPVTYLIVLVAFAVYDYISVYKTKHMLSLADSVLDLHLPIMLVVPKTMHYSFRKEHGRLRKAADEEAGTSKPRDALFIGLGDIVIPSIFALTALPLSFASTVGAFAGVEVGLLVLLYFVLKGQPHAGLPLLNAGAFLGFLVGLYLDQGTLVFW